MTAPDLAHGIAWHPRPGGAWLVRLWVPGRPAPQGSKRRTRHGGLVEVSRYLPAWRAAVHAAATPPPTGPAPVDHVVDVTATIYVARPAAHYLTRKAGPVLRPGAPLLPSRRGSGDVDKHARAILDALTYDPATGCGLYVDDAQVTECVTRKRYADDDHPPGADIAVHTRPAPTHTPQEP